MEPRDDDQFDINDPMNPDVSPPNNQDSGKKNSPFSSNENLSSEFREGEILFGIPEPEKIETREMSDAEKRHYEEIDSKIDDARFEQIAEQFTKQFSSIQIPKSIRSFGMYMLVGVAALIALFMIGQIMDAIAKIQTLPFWSQWVVGISLALVVGVLLFLIYQLTVLFSKLRRNEPIHLVGLRALAEREELRKYGIQQANKGKDRLIDYLSTYPIENHKLLLSAGLLQSDIDILNKYREILLKDAKTENSQKWIEKFYAGFQIILDEAAKRRVKSYAIKTGLKTSISAMPLLDNIIMLTMSLLMIKDLSILYHLYLKPTASAMILVRAFAQAYLAGEMQDLSESLYDNASKAMPDSSFETLSTYLTEQFGEQLSGQIAQMSSKVSKIIGSKAGEGFINGLLVKRLGYATLKLLRPVEI
jgi:uncharacterized membrane protein YcjF (UPF0283 family)